MKRWVCVSSVVIALGGCVAAVDTGELEEEQVDEHPSSDEPDPLLLLQVPPEPRRPIREPPPGFYETPPLWYEPGLYGGGGGWGRPGGLGRVPAGSGASSRDDRGPGGPLGVLCTLSWTSAQWAAYMTRFCAKRHSGVGGAGAASPEEAAERVRTCEGWTTHGFMMVMALCSAL